MTRISCLTLSLFLLTLAACSKKEEPMPAAGSPEANAPSATSPGAPVGPIASRGDAPMGGAGAGAQQAGEIDFDLPASWKSQEPSSMRLAQAEIPGSAGPGQLAVFYFGPGGGGTVEANIERWVTQMDPAPGADTSPQSFQTENGYKVTWVDVAGTLKPSTTGMGPAEEQAGSRLLGAVVEGPGGPWYFKATGPDATLAAERDNFLNLLKSVRAK